MITKADLETLSEARLIDAQELFKAARYSAAYYISGYSIEVGIKACIAKLFQADAIPDKGLVNAVYTHKLDELLGLAGIKERLKTDMDNDPALAAAWGIASKWNEDSRYKIWDQFAAASILDAVGNPNHGVLPWLRKHW